MSEPSVLETTILSPAEEADYPILVKLEALAFDNDDFTLVAFGKERHSPENYALRASHLPPRTHPFRKEVLTKATMHNTSQIVGFAEWIYVTNRQSPETIAATKQKEAEEEKRKASLSEEEKNKEDENSWGIGSNVKFCEDVFIVSDMIMFASCVGGDYCKLRNLVVHPDYQRRGIGTRLLQEGLAEADRLGLQSILGASPEGEDLYKRFGFEEVAAMDLKLWEYEGGEGLGIARHCIMRRPTPLSSTRSLVPKE